MDENSTLDVLRDDWGDLARKANEDGHTSSWQHQARPLAARRYKGQCNMCVSGVEHVCKCSKTCV